MTDEERELIMAVLHDMQARMDQRFDALEKRIDELCGEGVPVG